MTLAWGPREPPPAVLTRRQDPLRRGGRPRDTPVAQVGALVRSAYNRDMSREEAIAALRGYLPTIRRDFGVRPSHGSEPAGALLGDWRSRTQQRMGPGLRGGAGDRSAGAGAPAPASLAGPGAAAPVRSWLNDSAIRDTEGDLESRTVV